MAKSSPMKNKDKVLKVKKKTVAKKEVAVKEKPKIVVVKDKPDSYIEAVGRRKTAVARVRLFTHGEKTLSVNDRPYQQYFPTLELQRIAVAPLQLMNCLDQFRGTAKIRGGGSKAQAEALRHGLSRALTLFNATFRKRLKKAGFLTRDSRMRERKKFGLKRARRAPQWAKR